MSVPADVPVAPRASRKKVWLAAGLISLLSLAAAAAVVLRATTRAAAEPHDAPAAKPVRIAQAKQETVPLLAEYRGELVAEVAELAAQGAGRLVEVNRQLGESVEQGEVLVVVDAGETRRLLAEASAQIQVAEAAKARVEAQLKTAQREAERGKKLLAEELASEQDVLALESQVDVLGAEVNAATAERAAAAARASLYQRQLSESKLIAPFDGAVAERYLDPGSSVGAGTPVLRLVKGGELRVRFRVSEQHLERLEVGSSFAVKTHAGGDTVHRGTIERLGAEVSRSDRSVAAEGLLSEPSPGLRPGMYAIVKVELGMLENATTVPAAAILSRLDGEGRPESGVKVVKNGRAQYQRVDVLTEHEGRAAVSGLSPSTTVISFGQETVEDGAEVRAVDPSQP